jgi:hypothetical protein
LIEQPQSDCQCDGDREQRVRKRREHDVRADFPARAIYEWRAASAFDSGRGDHAGDDGEHRTDPCEAWAQPRRCNCDQADRPADQRCSFSDGE